jgi:hypothetical protein
MVKEKSLSRSVWDILGVVFFIKIAGSKTCSRDF